MAAKESEKMPDHSASVLETHSWRTAANSAAYLLPHLTIADKVLDIGCGPGSITIDLAKRVRRGHVTGVEYVEAPLEGARALAIQERVNNVTFQVGDIHTLPFEDGTFDVVHVHQVLQHVRDPVQALREMRRVAKKGGLVAVRESSSMTWYPESAALDGAWDLQKRMSKAAGGHPHPGSYIHIWAQEAGFERSRIECSTGSWCYASKAERQYWGGSMASRATDSKSAAAAIEGGFCTKEDLERFAQGWRDWVANEDAWFGMLHGQIVCRN